MIQFLNIFNSSYRLMNLRHDVINTYYVLKNGNLVLQTGSCYDSVTVSITDGFELRRPRY